MEKETNFEDDSFVARWVAGQLSPSEADQFDAWMKSHPGRRKHFEELRQVWLSYRDVRPDRGLSAEERWRRIAAAANLPDQPAENGRHKPT